jgi:hypothetical protein
MVPGVRIETMIETMIGSMIGTMFDSTIRAMPGPVLRTALEVRSGTWQPSRNAGVASRMK